MGIIASLSQSRTGTRARSRAHMVRHCWNGRRHARSGQHHVRIARPSRDTANRSRSAGRSRSRRHWLGSQSQMQLAPRSRRRSVTISAAKWAFSYRILREEVGLEHGRIQAHQNEKRIFCCGKMRPLVTSDTLPSASWLSVTHGTGKFRRCQAYLEKPPYLLRSEFDPSCRAVAAAQRLKPAQPAPISCPSLTTERRWPDVSLSHAACGRICEHGLQRGGPARLSCCVPGKTMEGPPPQGAALRSLKFRRRRLFPILPMLTQPRLPASISRRTKDTSRSHIART
jgi:hypothetical protein